MKHFPSFPNRTILTAPAASDLDPQGVGQEAAALDLPINILLVDDEVKNLTALETVLEDPAYRLIRASSADEALLALMAEEFALLILDIQMPGMNGFELATMIKSRRKTACVPIIFLTAYYSEDQHVTEGYVSGAVDFLHKPINAVVLRCKVSVFADLHRKTRDNLIANQALVVEVAQRKRTQEELRLLNAELEDRVESRTRELGESESRFRALAEGMPHFVWETDEAGLTTYRNARWQIYSGCAEKHTNNWLDLVHPGDAARMEECWKSTLKSGEEADWYCDRQSSQLARMVDDLLDVERINRGRIELKTTPLILETVLRSAIHAVQPAVTQKGHSLIFESEAELMVQGDAARLEQVFVLQAASPALAPPPSNLPPVQDPARLRLLIVDDHVDAAQTMGRLLKRRNFEVQIAHDGPSGLVAARDFKPEVLLLDIGLPGMDGYEVARTLRHDPACRSSLFIAISGYAQESDLKRSTEAGFEHHFAKPVNFGELLEAIGREAREAG